MFVKLKYSCVFIRNNIWFIFILLLLSQCKEEKEQPIILETSTISNISSTTAMGGGRVFFPDENEILSRGICWDTMPQPTLENNHTVDGKGNGSFNSVLTSLVPNREYFVRMYAETEARIHYGESISFITMQDYQFECQIVVDSTYHSQAFLKIKPNFPFYVTETDFGLCWDTCPFPTLKAKHDHCDKKVFNSDHDSKGKDVKKAVFQKVISGLQPDTRYFVRAYSQVGDSVSYSDTVSFTTKSFSCEINIVDVHPSQAFIDYRTGYPIHDSLTEFGFCLGFDAMSTISKMDDAESSSHCIVDSRNFEIKITSKNNNKPTNSFNRKIFSGLYPEKRYYLCTYTRIGQAIHYSDTVYFTTKAFRCIIEVDEIHHNKVFVKYKPDYPLDDPLVEFGFRTYINPEGTKNDSNETEAILAEKKDFIIGSEINIISQHEVLSKNEFHNARITDLFPETSYLARAFIRVGNWYFYSEPISFVTNEFGCNIEVISTFHNRILIKCYPFYPTNNFDADYTLCWDTIPFLTNHFVPKDLYLDEIKGFNKGNVCVENAPQKTHGKSEYYRTIAGLNPETKYFIGTKSRLNQITVYSNPIEVTTSEKFVLHSGTTLDSISDSSAYISYYIENQNLPQQVEHGVCIGHNPQPGTNEYVKHGIAQGGQYKVMVDRLLGAKHYARVYIKYPYGEDYGAELEFTPLEVPLQTLSDIDGNIYQYTKIGNKFWFTENLKTTHYNDGEAIPNITEAYEWSWSLVTGAYCWYENNENENKDTFGALYNWYAVNTGKLCPQGWRVPTNSDWNELENSLWGNSLAGGKMKSTGILEDGTGLWSSPNQGASNASKFSAMPAGGRLTQGRFIDKYNKTFFWSQSIAQITIVWIRSLDYRKNTLDRDVCDYNKRYGLSVRCTKDIQ